MRSLFDLGLASVLLLVATAVSAQEPFFQNGRTAWKIYLSPQAEQTEIYAAQELRDALRMISGADFEVVSRAVVPGSRAIILGDLKSAEVQSQAEALRLSPGKVEEVAVYTLGDRLYLRGFAGVRPCVRFSGRALSKESRKGQA